MNKYMKAELVLNYLLQQLLFEVEYGAFHDAL